MSPELKAVALELASALSSGMKQPDARLTPYYCDYVLEYDFQTCHISTYLISGEWVRSKLKRLANV